MFQTIIIAQMSSFGWEGKLKHKRKLKPQKNHSKPAPFLEHYWTPDKRVTAYVIVAL